MRTITSMLLHSCMHSHKHGKYTLKHYSICHVVCHPNATAHRTKQFKRIGPSDDGKKNRIKAQNKICNTDITTAEWNIFIHQKRYYKQFKFGGAVVVDTAVIVFVAFRWITILRCKRVFRTFVDALNVRLVFSSSSLCSMSGSSRIRRESRFFLLFHNCTHLVRCNFRLIIHTHTYIKSHALSYTFFAYWPLLSATLIILLHIENTTFNHLQWSNL